MSANLSLDMTVLVNLVAQANELRLLEAGRRPGLPASEILSVLEPLGHMVEEARAVLARESIVPGLSDLGEYERLVSSCDVIALSPPGAPRALTLEEMALLLEQSLDLVPAKPGPRLRLVTSKEGA